MPRRIFIFIAFVLGIELYAFQAFTTAIGPSAILTFLYFTLTVMIITGISLFFNTGFRDRIKLPQQSMVFGFFIFFLPKIFISIFLLIEDLVRVVKSSVNLFAGSSFHLGTERSETLSWIAIIFSAVLMIAFIYGALFNVYNYKLKNINVKLMTLPKSFHGLKVVQISDIHSGSLSDKKAVKRAVDKINHTQPDLIFFTGDLVNNIAVEAVEFVDVFSQLKATHGVYSILGNHDYGDYMSWHSEEAKVNNLDHLKSIHQQMGWRLLLNEHVHIEREGEKIVVAGVENWSARGRFRSYGKLEHTLNGIHDAFTVLLLSHDPSHWEAEILDHPAKVDITFSGHTHGMQFGFEFLNFKWSPVKYFYKHWAGLYENTGQYLYVNRGFGVIGYRGRVGILPEITLFTLHASEE